MQLASRPPLAEETGRRPPPLREIRIGPADLEATAARGTMQRESIIGQRGPRVLMAANGNWRSTLAARWRTTASGPFFETTQPSAEYLPLLPADYVAEVTEFGGREGFLGETYLRLYRLEELAALNFAYEVPALFPEAIVFGSDGGGNGFAFLVNEPAVVQVPFLPLCVDYVERRALSFTDFVQSLAASGESPAYNPAAVGMEVHETHPVCLGGSPTDPANKVLVPPTEHAELCRFWNKVYRDAAPGSKAAPDPNAAGTLYLRETEEPAFVCGRAA